MNRLFGIDPNKKKDQITLEQATSKLDTRIQSLDTKITSLDNELAQLQKQLSLTRPGSSTRETLRGQARTLLSQKRLFQMQRQKLAGQSMNLFQMEMASSSLADATDTLEAMKLAKKQLQKNISKANPEMAEVLGEEVSELVSDAWEVQELLGRSYAVDDGAQLVDEFELEEELKMLEETSGIDGSENDLFERARSDTIKIDLPELPTSFLSYPKLNDSSVQMNK
jgi:charged multivesicular body protein 5